MKFIQKIIQKKQYNKLKFLYTILINFKFFNLNKKLKQILKLFLKINANFKIIFKIYKFRKLLIFNEQKFLILI